MVIVDLDLEAMRRNPQVRTAFSDVHVMNSNVTGWYALVAAMADTALMALNR